MYLRRREGAHNCASPGEGMDTLIGSRDRSREYGLRFDLTKSWSVTTTEDTLAACWKGQEDGV